MQPVFITGMFRSGTTLLGRMLHAHPQIAIASDGIFPFFKYLRDAIATLNGMEMQHQFDRPLSDYYFEREQYRLFSFIQNSTLDVELKSETLMEIKNKIKYWCTDNDQYSPKLHPHVDNLKGDTYRQLYENITNIIHIAYGNGQTKVVGPKEVWTGEFIPVIEKSFPETKFIYIVRDPRAVFASKKNREAKYPWLFMSRQWRKLATLGHVYSKWNARLKNKICLIFFEKLISEPEKTAKQICEFLEIDFNDNMIKPESFVNGRGHPWVQNTAYKGKGKTAFNIKTNTRWKSSLLESEIELIEYLCGPEMNALGYKLENEIDDISISRIIKDPAIVPDSEIAGWIKKYEKNEYEHIVIELSKERLRYELIKAEDISEQQKYDVLIKLNFLNNNMYDYIKRSYLH